MPAPFAFTFDWKRFGVDLVREAQRLNPVVETIRRSGAGEVVVRRRKKESWERGKKIPNNAFLSNMLRSQGHDPFDYPQALVDEVREPIVFEAEDAIASAHRTGRPQPQRIQRVLRAGADHIARAVVARMESGGLGASVGKYAKRKAILVNRGRGTKRYGRVPPVGILTSRLLRAIGSRWRLGRRGL